MYQCFHCLTNGVIWDADFTFEDYGLEGEGIVHHCHCANCGAEIEYYVPITEEDISELKERFGEDNNRNLETGRFAKGENTWVERKRTNGEKYSLGCFTTMEEAVAARRDAERRLYGNQF